MNLEEGQLVSIQQKAGLKDIFVLASLGDFISQIVPYIFYFAGGALLIYFLIGGFNLMLAGGDPKKMESGKKTITNAIIGFVVIFVAYWIVQLIGAIFGIEGIKNAFGVPVTSAPPPNRPGR